MGVTTEQLVAGFVAKGMSIQALNAGKGVKKLYTAGSVSLDSIVEAFDVAEQKNLERTPEQLAIIEAAREKWAVPSGDDMLIYDDAKVSQAGDDGVWVEARVFLRHGEF